ncbi:MAG TPA: zinc-binding dehydrogenase [Streptosporangiaceae bacterium]|jgi:NADPH2:quinone reductase|nr:zinc-binding dehydrogenase [Streptosporangiaceae bacterium]
MAEQTPSEGLQLRSLVRADQVLEVFLESVTVPEAGPGEVLVRVEAAPVNPSDLGLLFGGADLAAAVVTGSAERPVLTAPIPDAGMRALAGRVGTPMPGGNEGAGTVVAAGSSAEAQALLGKTVAVAGGAMYSQYRLVNAAACLQLPDGTPAIDGASSFVNPMTVLGMVETMRMEGHTALVHTAAASNLGQMLSRLCIEEQIPLVNIVRKQADEELLRSTGAAYVCNSAATEFARNLTGALRETGATLAFDAVGGGKLASQILTCMEAAVSEASAGYSRYGSAVHKQVYIYGSLDRGPTELTRGFGMAWGLGGWLLTPFLQKIGAAGVARLRNRVADGLATTFASSYAGQMSLAGALQPAAIAQYGRMATGSKYVIVPTLA